jgi:hypothetical protein
MSAEKVREMIEHLEYARQALQHIEKYAHDAHCKLSRAMSAVRAD